MKVPCRANRVVLRDVRKRRHVPCYGEIAEIPGSVSHESRGGQVLVRQMTHVVKLAGRRSPLAPILRALLKRSAPLARELKLGRTDNWPRAAQWLLSAPGTPSLRDPRLLDALRYDINRDIDTELLLTEVRKALLLGRSRDLWNDPTGHPFLCALLQQCINNEYVWFVSDEEQSRIQHLSGPAVAPPLTSPDAWPTLLVLALYRPLHELLGLATASAPLTLRALGWLPDPFRLLVQDYVESHQEEMTIKHSIERFGAISDDVSRTVAAMYEVFPYPRWVRLAEPAPGARQKWLTAFLGQAPLFLNRPFDVLVPGCGTGRKAIQIALGFGEQARVLATDLSRASLAYAARMARKYRLRNIQFLQMDILDLPKFAQQFDVVECTGVLVCVADPLKTWKVLVDHTRPSGLVHVSLYSELARREIVRLRKDYEHQIATIDTDFIRAYRRRLMLEQPATVDALPTRGDFFDLSRCKDLLFHPVEHRFTIPQIRRYIAALGLEFRGFEPPKPLASRYWTPFPRPAHQRDLDRWWQFEQKYPDAFQDLYEIWCRKS